MMGYLDRIPKHFIKSLPGERTYNAMKCFIRLEQMYGKKHLTYMDVTNYIGGKHKQTCSLIRELRRKQIIKKANTKVTATAMYSLTNYGRNMYRMLEELEEEYQQITTTSKPKQVHEKLKNSVYREGRGNEQRKTSSVF